MRVKLRARGSAGPLQASRGTLASAIVLADRWMQSGASDVVIEVEGVPLTVETARHCLVARRRGCRRMADQAFGVEDGVRRRNMRRRISLLRCGI